MKHHLNLLVGLGVLAFFVAQGAFIVPQTQQVLVLQFGNPVAEHTEPGLKFKIPFIQEVRVFDNRVLDVDPPAEEVILADQKRLVVDTFARYKINKMLEFYKSLASEEQAMTRLDNIINSTVREVMGNAKLADILSEKREDIMAAVQKKVNASVTRFGIEIVDVRIGRADLPDQTSQSIYARMRTERQREAAQFRALGQELAQQIRAEADKERTVLLAEAEKKAQILRGDGDAQAIKIYAGAYGKDPGFYGFYRTMQAYRESMAGDNTTLVLTPDSDFMRYFRDESGKK